MTNEEKARELAKEHSYLYDDYKSIEYECFNSSLEMAEWKDEQLKNLIHKASLAYMQDLGEQLGHIQLKSAIAMKNCKDEDMLERIKEIVLATTRANSFMLSLEKYLQKELNTKEC